MVNSIGKATIAAIAPNTCVKVKQLVFRYLECGSVGGGAPDLLPCLERMQCLLHDPSVRMSREEKQVAHM